jgi:cytidylate kinase
VIIAIDGPAGAGKSSVARGVADTLCFQHLDSGAMYRCAALAELERGRPAGEIAETLNIKLGDRVFLDGRDVSEAIRTPEVGTAASRVAADPAVRRALVAKQRALLSSGGDWVVEGRDIGTVVAPDAELKFFLTASEGERARRRAIQDSGEPAAVARELEHRDRRDSGRAHSPLRPADDAILLDTTELTLDQVIDRIVELELARETGERR